MLGIKSNSWIKAFHVIFACAWFGAVISVILIFLLTNQTASQEILKNNSKLMETIDLYIIVPSSLSCYLLGILLSWKTNWGFFKFKWIVVKMVLGTVLIMFGFFFLGPWILEANETKHLHDFRQIQEKLGISMILQAIVIVVTLIISTTKPWGRIKS